MSKYIIKEINDSIIQIKDPMGSCITIIKGTSLSLVIDTGYGFFDLKEIINKYIKTPYKVLCTHGHMDHTCGSYVFDEIYLSHEDYELFKKHNSIERRKLNIIDGIESMILDKNQNYDGYLNVTLPIVIFYKDNETFNLGNYTVTVIKMPGHTKGSVGFLIKELNILLTGDAAILQIWLFLDDSTDKDSYIKMLENVYKLNFKYFLTGHLLKLYPKHYFNYFIEVAKNANINNSKLVTYKNFEYPNTYRYEETHEGDIIAINYRIK